MSAHDPAVRPERMCRCVSTVNRLFAKENTELAVTFNLRGQVFPKIELERRSKDKPYKRRLLIPTFCPFCGRPYPGQRAIVPAAGVLLDRLAGKRRRG